MFSAHAVRPVRSFLYALALSFFSVGLLHAQAPQAQPAPVNPPPSVGTMDTGCCGPVTPAGKRLRQVLDSMDVDHLWQNHLHINWKTGVPDKPADYTGPDMHSHCSAFAAAVGDNLGIYMLRPPEHPQQLLASAQGHWFESKDSRKEGWTPVGGSKEAQTLANRGELVVIVYVSPDESRPGHIAIVRPAMKTDDLLAKEGPQTTQAGAHNFSNGNAKASFTMHANAWPDGVKMYAHHTTLESEKATQSVN